MVISIFIESIETPAGYAEFLAAASLSKKLSSKTCAVTIHSFSPYSESISDSFSFKQIKSYEGSKNKFQNMPLFFKSIEVGHYFQKIETDCIIFFSAIGYMVTQGNIFDTNKVKIVFIRLSNSQSAIADIDFIQNETEESMLATLEMNADVTIHLTHGFSKPSTISKRHFDSLPIGENFVNKPNLSNIDEAEVDHLVLPLMNPDISIFEMFAQFFDIIRWRRWQFPNIPQNKTLKIEIPILQTSNRHRLLIEKWINTWSGLHEFIEIDAQLYSDSQSFIKTLAFKEKSLFTLTQDTPLHHALSLQKIKQNGKILCYQPSNTQYIIDANLSSNFIFDSDPIQFCNILAKLFKQKYLVARLDSKLVEHNELIDAIQEPHANTTKEPQINTIKETQANALSIKAELKAEKIGLNLFVTDISQKVNCNELLSPQNDYLLKLSISTVSVHRCKKIK